VRVPHHHFFPNNEQYRNRIFEKKTPANDNEFRVNKVQRVEQLDAAHLTEFEWARQTSKTWDMGQD
jgi:hypothetical protein